MIRLKDILKEEGSYVPGSIKTTHKMNVPSLGYSTPESKKFVEKDLIYPLILGRDLKQWNYKYSQYWNVRSN